MSDIKLFEGCWVKTLEGHVVGPMVTERVFGATYFKSPYCSGGVNWDERGECSNDCYNVIAVYPTLAAASAANPEL